MTISDETSLQWQYQILAALKIAIVVNDTLEPQDILKLLEESIVLLILT